MTRRRSEGTDASGVVRRDDGTRTNKRVSVKLRGAPGRGERGMQDDKGEGTCARGENMTGCARAAGKERGEVTSSGKRGRARKPAATDMAEYSTDICTWKTRATRKGSADGMGGAGPYNEIPSTDEWEWIRREFVKVRRVRPDGSCMLWAVASAMGRLTAPSNSEPSDADLVLEHEWRADTAEYARVHRD